MTKKNNNEENFLFSFKNEKLADFNEIEELPSEQPKITNQLNNN